MARNALHVLLRVREVAVTRARGDLAEAHADEQRAGERLDAHRSLMAGEQEAATPAMLRDYAAWLPWARSHEAVLRAAVVRNQARVVRCREALAACRVSAEAVAKAVAHQDTEACVRRTRMDQATTDEVAGRARPDFLF